MEWCKDYAPQCEACRDIYNRRNPPQEPPCATCKVDLNPNNEDAAAIFQKVKNQVITIGMEGKPVALNYQSVKMVMDLYGVKNQKDCFDKVVKVFSYYLLNREDENGWNRI